jgi:hypothetical protein
MSARPDPSLTQVDVLGIDVKGPPADSKVEGAVPSSLRTFKEPSDTATETIWQAAGGKYRDRERTARMCAPSGNQPLGSIFHSFSPRTSGRFPEPSRLTSHRLNTPFSSYQA